MASRETNTYGPTDGHYTPYSQSLLFIVLLRTFETSMGFVNYTNAMDIGNTLRQRWTESTMNIGCKAL